MCPAGLEELVGAQDSVLRGLASCLSSAKKAAKLGCLGLKIPDSDKESLKANVEKKWWKWGSKMRAVGQELRCKNKIKNTKGERGGKKSPLNVSEGSEHKPKVG